MKLLMSLRKIHVFLALSFFVIFLAYSGVAAVTLLPLSAFAAPIDNLQPGEWYEFPNSKMNAVDPCPKRGCVYSGTGGQANVMDAWGGGAYDTKRDQLIVWGGGHSDYGGNEVYAFGPLTSPTPKWSRITEPSQTVVGCVDIYPDGTPTARHTYNAIQYDPIRDMFISLIQTSHFTTPTCTGPLSARVNALPLDPVSLAKPAYGWKNDYPMFANGDGIGMANQIPTGQDHAGSSSAWDPVRQGFWLKSVTNAPFAFFDPAGNGGAGLWQWKGNAGPYTVDSSTMAIDSKRRHLVLIGGNPASTTYWGPGLIQYDLNNLSSTITHPVSSGDAGGKAAEISGNPGFVYDPVGDRFLAWNARTAVYALDPVTFVWSTLSNYAGSTVNPGAKNTNGTFGRFRYVPSKGGLIVVNRTKESVFFYKLTNAISSPPTAVITPTPIPVVTPTHTTGTITANAVSTPTGAITAVQIVSTAAQTNVPITFGQVFKQGDVPTGFTIAAKDSLGHPVTIQVDKKATHADGSLRHAVISAVIPSLAAGQTETIALIKATAASAPYAVKPATLTAAGFTARVNITLGGVVYTASADSLLTRGPAVTWLSGPVVNEWMVSTPLKNAAGVAHPHLAARFAIRSYTGQSKARVDVTIENDWAYEPNPQNFTYDANIIVGGNTVYSASALKHYHHARWRKVYWWGTAPQVDVKLNKAYLIATKAVPNYDQSIIISPTGLSALANQWTVAGTKYNIATQYGISPQTYDTNMRTGPMGQGIINPYMPAPGGSPGIGPLSQMSAMYLLSMDSRAKNVMLGTADLAGSWPVHYRDKDTGLPINIVTYPYASTSNSIDPSGHNWKFPALVPGSSNIPLTPDSSHQPSLVYLPYLVTGDYYYLEELQFWANWNMLQIDHGSRTYGGGQGLMHWDQIRGQAWSMRTMGQVAYITPDTHPMKSYWMDRVRDNLADYHAKFVVANPNQLGIMEYTASYFFKSIIYGTDLGANTGYPPWQDDFFTWSMGYLAELGFTDAAPILAWKAKFVIGRNTTPGFCHVDAAAYSLAVRPSATSALYTTLAEVWAGTYDLRIDTNPASSTYKLYYKDQPCGSTAQALWKNNTHPGIHLVAGESLWGADSPEGFPSNMQPALAVAAVSGIPNAAAAWTVYKNAPVHPNYSIEPQFAIVPRTSSGTTPTSSSAASIEPSPTPTATTPISITTTGTIKLPPTTRIGKITNNRAGQNTPTDQSAKPNAYCRFCP